MAGFLVKVGERVACSLDLQLSHLSVPVIWGKEALFGLASRGLRPVAGVFCVLRWSVRWFAAFYAIAG